MPPRAPESSLGSAAIARRLMRAIRRPLRRIATVTRSMFGQLALLTAVFLAWGTYTFVIQPIIETYPQRPPPPIEATASRLRDAFYNFMAAEANGQAVTPLSETPIVRAIEARNPGFRYYVRVDGRAFGTGKPTLFHARGLDQVERVQRTLHSANVCSQVVQGADKPGSYIHFYMCDKLAYFEYHGLFTPISNAQPDMEGAYSRWLWSYSRSFLAATGGMFLIFALIFGTQMVLIRRISSLARAIDPRRLDRQLPEKGLAVEILPLVRAVNSMMARVDDYQRHNAFFLSAAAHEMRTPLTVLRTRLEMVEDEAIKEKLAGDVRSLITLVNQLLALMTITNRREPADFADLVECCERVIADLMPLAESRQVAIAFAPDLPSFDVPGDATLIRSAIANIVENAIGFAPAGSTVRVRIDRMGGVTVRDAGPGLGHADPALLFEPFVRASTARRGHGLGLAIAKAVAKLHGGDIGAADSPEGGALFWISFHDAV